MSAPPPTPPAAPRPPSPTPADRGGLRWLPEALAALAAFGLVWGLAAGWIWLGSEDGLRTLTERAVAASDGRLRLEGVSGSLAEKVQVERLSWADAGTEVEIESVRVTLDRLSLLRLELGLLELQAAQVRVRLPVSEEPATPPATLRPPLGLALRDARIARLQIEQGEAPPQVLQAIELSLRHAGRAWVVEHLALAREGDTLRLHGKIADTAPFALSAEAQLEVARVTPPLAVTLGVGGTLAALDVAARSVWRQAALDLRARVQPFDERPLATLDLNAQDLDLAALIPGAPQTRIRAKARAVAWHAPTSLTPAGGLALLGTFSASNALPGAWDTGRVPLAETELEFRLDGPRWQVTAGEALGPAGRVRFSAEADASGRSPFGVGRLVLETDRLALQKLHRAAPDLTLAGGLRAWPEGSQLAIELSLAEGGRALQARARVDHERLTVQNARLVLREGTAEGAGHFEWAAPQHFDLLARFERLDPALWDVRLTGRLSGRVALHGALTGPTGLSGVLTLADSTLLERPLSVQASGAWLPGTVRDLDLALRWGSARLSAQGALGRMGDRLTVSADLARLADFDARIAGKARVDAVLQDRITQPVLALSARVEGLQAAGVNVEALRATVNGSLEQHRIELRAKADALGLDAALALEGAMFADAPGPRGTARVLSLRNRGRWALELLAPTAIEWTTRSAAVGPLALALEGEGGARIDLDALRWSEDRLQLGARATAVPVRWLLSRVDVGRGLKLDEPDALRLQAQLKFEGPSDAPQNGQGVLEISRSAGDLTLELPAAEGGIERLKTGLEALAGRLQWGDGRLSLKAGVRGSRLGVLEIDAQTPWSGDLDRMALQRAPLEGRVEMRLPSLAFLRALAGEAWRFGGSLQAGLALSGTLGGPQARGRIEGRELTAEQRELGMRLSQGELRATMDGQTVDVERLHFVSGAGQVTMSGALRPDGRSDALLRLDQLPIPIGAGQRLILSGDARAALRGGELGLSGALRADEGVIEITTSSAPAVSADVVVVANATEAVARTRDREAARRPATRTKPERSEPTTADVQDKGFRVQSTLAIDLGDRFRVFGAGVDARLEGQLRLQGRLPDAPRLTGTVRIAQGTYTGFGQKLEIERGDLVFSGPVDNPAIDIVAYRRYLPVEAGVSLTGTARQPKVTLVSRPEVSEPEKLSWLVLGTGSDTARSSNQSAALAAAGLLLAGVSPASTGPGLVQRLGLDVVSIRSGPVGSTGEAGSAAASAQDSIVTLGKRLTERLFVSYEQSVRGLQNLVRLQYEISERLSARLKAGTENAINLVWTWRYD